MAWETQTVTYHFDGYDAGEAWPNSPALMVDGNESNYANSSTNNQVELCNSNTCDGSTLGAIDSVWVRARGTRTNYSAYGVKARPVFGGTVDGACYNLNFTKTPGQHDISAYKEITDDLQAPSKWLWTDIQDLDMDVLCWVGGVAGVNCGKIELKVVYKPSLKPDVIDVELSMPAPQIYASTVSRPQLLEIDFVVPDPTIHLIDTIKPAPAVFTFNVPAPTFKTIFKPAALDIDFVVPEVTVSYRVKINATPFQINLSVPSVTLREIWRMPNPLEFNFVVPGPRVGPGVKPSKYQVQLRNKNFDLIKVLHNKIEDIDWEYERIGGCGLSNITLRMAFEELDSYVDPDYDVQVWLERENHAGAELVYRGFLETYTPTVDRPDKVTLKIAGYSSHLRRMAVNKTYTDMEVSDIVKDILDTFVKPYTAITYNLVDIDIRPTEFVVDSIEFDTTADDAIKTLAELAGNVEWGVDRNLRFYFKKEDLEIRHRIKLLKQIKKYDLSFDYKSIVNRLEIRGGTVDDVNFSDTINNLESQTAYGLRTEVLSNSAIVTSAVSQRYGTIYLSDKARINRRAKIKVVDNYHFFEKSVPIGALHIVRDEVATAKKYNDVDAIYGAIKYGGEPSLQIDRLRYKIEGVGTSLSIEAGAPLPSLSQEIKKLDFQIAQLRNT